MMAIDERLAAAQDGVARLYREMRREAEEPLERLQQASRWLRNAETLAQWVESLAEAGSTFAVNVVVFSIEGGAAVVKAARGPQGANCGTAKLAGRGFPLGNSPALKQAAQSGEVVVCLRAPSQVPFDLLDAIGESGERRSFVLPVPGRNRVVGLLYAEGHVRLSALETLAALAGGSLLLRNPGNTTKNTVTASEHSAPVPANGANQLLHIAPAPASGQILPGQTSSAPLQLSPERVPLPMPTQLAPAMLPARLEARRFARMWITKMVLENPADVVQGRQSKNLFARFRVKIEEGRREYSQRLLPGDSADENYFNEELVRQLAQGDIALLGEELAV